MQIVEAASRSAAQIAVHNRPAARLRLHPLDAEVIIAEQQPDKPWPHQLKRLIGLPVVLDDNVRIGAPVAEFDP